MGKTPYPQPQRQHCERSAQHDVSGSAHQPGDSQQENGTYKYKKADDPNTVVHKALPLRKSNKKTAGEKTPCRKFQNLQNSS